MPKLEVLCVTMHQKDFSKIKEMNIHSDVIFANQHDTNAYEECVFDGHKAKMVTTDSRGVGRNRNFALLYASADYCLLADDDVVYKDEMESIVISEFEKYPDADVMIFHFDSDDISRAAPKCASTKKRSFLDGLPWGGINIAFRLESIRKANVWFTTLFGGGTTFPSGEDSIFLTDLIKAGLNLYISNKTIGTVSYATSTWFTGFDEKYYYGKGAFYQAARPKLKFFWMVYMALRTRKEKQLDVWEKMKWMNYGVKGYKDLIPYDEFAGRN